MTANSSKAATSGYVERLRAAAQQFNQTKEAHQASHIEMAAAAVFAAIELAADEAEARIKAADEVKDFIKTGLDQSAVAAANLIQQTSDELTNLSKKVDDNKQSIFSRLSKLTVGLVFLLLLNAGQAVFLGWHWRHPTIQPQPSQPQSAELQHLIERINQINPQLAKLNIQQSTPPIVNPPSPTVESIESIKERISQLEASYKALEATHNKMIEQLAKLASLPGAFESVSQTLKQQQEQAKNFQKDLDSIDDQIKGLKADLSIVRFNTSKGQR